MLALLWYQSQIKILQEKKTMGQDTGEDRCKNSQENASKPNWIAHLKTHIPRSSGTYPWDTKDDSTHTNQ